MTPGPPDLPYRGAGPSRAGRTGLSEDTLVECPAIELFKTLGWTHFDLFGEVFAADGSPWRESRREAFLTKPLRLALARLNLGLPQDALDLALDTLTRATAPPWFRSQPNREVLELLRDGIDVEYRNADGAMTKERVLVVDWRDAGANSFILASQTWFSGRVTHAAHTI